MQTSVIRDRDDTFVRLAVEGEDRVLVDRAGSLALWGPGTRPSIRPDIDILPRPDGFDLVASFHNTENKRRSPGVLYLPGIRFPRVVRTRDFYVDAKPRTIDRGTSGGTYFGGGNVYPGSIYSPVAIIGDDDYTLGVSLLYPVLDYKHRTFIRSEVPNLAGGALPQVWQVRFELNPSGVTGGIQQWSPEGDLAPDERRTYRLCVRVMRRHASENDAGAPQEWLRLLEPYRSYFAHRYGPVEYTRDPRPVQAVSISYPGNITVTNPNGFVGPTTRPDLFGWGPWAANLRLHTARGWHRFMLWAPSGLFYQSRGFNYPFQFTSGWLRLPAARESLGLLHAFATETAPQARELGLWWGHSANYHATWEPQSEPLLDPSDPEHLAAIHRELDGADAAGATMIGLDTFPRMSEWVSIPYLRDLRARHPRLRFLVEPMPCDVLHRVASAYILGTRPPTQISFRVENPHYLADFINPGHETWAAIHENDIRAELGIDLEDPLSRARIIPVLRRYAQMGYVPTPFSSVPLDGDEGTVRAAESWSQTAPWPRAPAAAPESVLSPRSASVLPGDTLTLRAAFTGTDLCYRWTRDGQVVENSTSVSGADTPVLILQPVLGIDAGRYVCHAGNFLGDDASAPADVTVGCVTDFNADGTVNADDLGDFIGAFFFVLPRDPRCDVNADGYLDADDLGAFLNVFFLGC
ncbi:MAG: hypothetical protein AB7Q91_06120 [Phycisphaerales bacterium]